MILDLSMTPGPCAGLLVSGLPLLCLLIHRAALALANGKHQDDDPLILDAIDQPIPCPAQFDLIAVL